MLDSQPAVGIRKFGFRRWFHQQLTESHVYLVSGLLCLILVLAAIEQAGLRNAALERALMWGLAICGGALGLICLERYRIILSRALHFSGRSTCRNCAADGQFQVLDAARVGDWAERSAHPWLRVKCRKCGTEWVMD
jgi:hypothetical protein